MIRVGILGSGRGSNFEAIAVNIISGYLSDVSISVVISDNSQAPLLSRAKKFGMESFAVDPYTFLPQKLNAKGYSDHNKKHTTNSHIDLGLDKTSRKRMWNAHKDIYYKHLADELTKRKVNLVILAGFMRIVGKPLIERFPNRIMNIHPALLPSFPGLHSQKQALNYGVKISGCTVHFVDEGVDTGPIIMQAAVPVFDDDTEETLSERILKEEHRIYSKAIQFYAHGKIRVQGRKVTILDADYNDNCLINPQ
jgi:phosphoribosylglycinamide formyltransferase-1